MIARIQQLLLEHPRLVDHLYVSPLGQMEVPQLYLVLA